MNGTVKEVGKSKGEELKRNSQPLPPTSALRDTKAQQRKTAAISATAAQPAAKAKAQGQQRRGRVIRS